MRSVLSYLLLVVYATLLVKPVLPFFIDIAQHIFNYKEHITTVHFENGTYHVHKELKANEKKGRSEGAASNEKKSVSQNEFIFNGELKTFLLVLYLPRIYSECSSNLESTLLYTDFPPPKVSIDVFYCIVI